MISDIGYQEIEFFGPHPVSAPESIQAPKPLRAQLKIKENTFYAVPIKDTSTTQSKESTIKLDSTMAI